MYFIEKNKAHDWSVEFAVVLEEDASTLTQGRPGPGDEGYCQTKH